MDESLEFMELVVNEMDMRGQCIIDKNINQLCQEVKECLEAESRMKELINHISHSATRADAMDWIMHYVPCIMHCENRAGLKIFTTLLEEGLSNAQGGK